MFHRLAALLIIGFWLAMTGLLVVRELYPESTRLNDIPMSHIAKIAYQHRQSSDLVIYDSDKEIGYIHFKPRFSKDGEVRVLDFHGNLTVSPIGFGTQRLSWLCEIDLDGGNNVTRVSVDLSSSDPVNRLDLEVDNVRKTARYAFNSGGKVWDENTLTLDQAGFLKLFERLGIDATLLKQLQAAQKEVPTITYDAQESSTTINGEKVETYLVTMHIGGQPVFLAHLSQLGVVLRAKVPMFNYRLAPQHVTP